VTDFANDPAASFLSILRPVFLRKAAGIHTIKYRKRRLDLAKVLLRALRER
jgi:hypothetical protein